LNKQKICAVVVTYNRKNLLIETLNALVSQEYPLKGIYIIDNASVDGTEKELYEKKFINVLPDCKCKKGPILIENNIQYRNYSIKIHYLKMKKNEGGAGGFYEGIKRSYEKGYDWIWIMDDDVIPEKDALKNLMKKNKEIKETVGFLSSRVVGENNISMNVPTIDERLGENHYPTWDEKLDINCVKLRNSTFVSVLINREVIKNVGYPIKQMFIWGDDIEYTTRISNHYPSFLVGNSKVIHKRKIQKSLDLRFEKDPNRIKNYFYYYRNNAYVLKKYFPKKKLLSYYLKNSILILFLLKEKYRFKKIYVILKGLFFGILFNPNIEKPEE